jgi:hypothetical protein
MDESKDAEGTGAFEWDGGNTKAPLETLLKYVEDHAQESIDWYWKSKKLKSVLARWILFAVVVLISATAVGPIVGQIFAPLHALTNGLWATFLVGVAAALLALDKTFDLSSGWKRYVMAATNIKKALEEFRMDWVSMLAKTGPEPTPQQVEALIARAKQFHVTVEGYKLQETKEWVAEFQSNFSRVEKEVGRAQGRH